MKKLAMTVLIIALVGSTVMFAEDKAATTTDTKAATVAPAAITTTGLFVSAKAADAVKKTPATVVIKADGKDVVLTLSATTKIVGTDGKAAVLAAVKAPAKVSAVYTAKAGVNVTESITLVK